MATLERAPSRTNSGNSTIADPDMDEERSEAGSRASSVDPRNSLQHVLGETSSARDDTRGPFGRSQLETTPFKNSYSNYGEQSDYDDEMEDSGIANERGKKGRAGDTKPRKINVNSVSSGYTVNKIKHLKKEDGEPLWRRDIQHDLLRAIFEDTTPVFTDSYNNEGGKTFADIYIHTMALSSKTSKILRDKLLSDRPAALSMAMVCLLVNIGRMNTTLNFFPEMRAQLRTYHSIPSLQAERDPNAYKQLQDAPRLKSILKGASDDRPNEPDTLEKLKARPVPRTNPVNVIFIFAKYSSLITELHFNPQDDFFDIIMRHQWSSQSRSRAFLWLMWFYLESDFSEEAALKNPFGPGLPPAGGGMPQKVPPFVTLTPEELELENIDTPEEQEFAQVKMDERRRYNELEATFTGVAPRRGRKRIESLAPQLENTGTQSEDGASPTPQKSVTAGGSVRARQKKKFPTQDQYASESDDRSGSPSQFTLSKDANQGSPSGGSQSRGRQRPAGSRSGGRSQRIVLKTKISQTPDGGIPSGYGQSMHSGTGDQSGVHPRRPRLQTAHQAAVERNRRERVEYILDRKLQSEFKRKRWHREREGAMFRTWRRLAYMNDSGADSDDEVDVMMTVEGSDFVKFRNGALGPGSAGLIPLEAEDDDYGEEVSAFAAAIRRTGRRLDRWETTGAGKKIVRESHHALVDRQEEHQLQPDGDDYDEEDEGDEIEEDDEADDADADEMDVD